MTSGRHSRRREFTQVPSPDSIFVYMIPPQNAMPGRYGVKSPPKIRGTQREYSSKPLKHSTVKPILVYKR